MAQAARPQLRRALSLRDPHLKPAPRAPAKDERSSAARASSFFGTVPLALSQVSVTCIRKYLASRRLECGALLRRITSESAKYLSHAPRGNSRPSLHSQTAGLYDICAVSHD